MSYWLQQLVNIFQVAGFYVPLAVAFALIQGITGRIFLSFGDLAMYASFVAIYVCFDALLRGHGDWTAVVIALGIAIVCGAALGGAIAKSVFDRKLCSSSQSFMIASLGLSIALKETMRLQSGSRDIWITPLFAGRTITITADPWPVHLPVMTLIGIATSALAVISVVLVMHHSSFGRQWRAVEQAPALAPLCGVNTGRVITLTFMLASGLAAVSGWLSALSYGGTNFSIGLMMGFKAMFASVIGGFGTVGGAIAGGLALAAIEIVWSAYFSTAWRDVAVFAIIIMVLLLRPEGLLGVKTRRESETP
jgi:branched-chain amino acid transport system permease protein